MAVDAFTSRLGLILQATGNNLNTWGQKLNSYALQPVDDAIAGAVALSVSGPVTLTATPGAPNQARMAMLKCTGTGGTVIVPSVTKRYLVDASAATGAIVITTGSGVSASVEAGNRVTVFSPNGVDFYIARDSAAQAAATLAAKNYTDQQVLKANAGNLPGGASPGSYLYTDPNTGNAGWRIPVITDVTGLSAALANQQKLAIAFAAAL